MMRRPVRLARAARGVHIVVGAKCCVAIDSLKNMSQTHEQQTVVTTNAARTVVLIDDDPDVRESVAELLRSAGHEVTSFANCTKALMHICQTDPPAVVIVDLLMPGMNAWEFIGQMRRREKFANVPVIAITGSLPAWGSPVPEAMVARKPIDPARLLQLVEKACAAPG